LNADERRGNFEFGLIPCVILRSISTDVHRACCKSEANLKLKRETETVFPDFSKSFHNKGLCSTSSAQRAWDFLL
jgi:hypothetical protein